ncbi:MAG: FkbM family methyltransferase [Planctomycetota bacterium]|jgi:FkbM family methyltransferase
MKVFMDIGAYNGDTLKLAGQYDYEQIHCFEPSIQHHQAIIKIIVENGWKDRVQLHKFGLGNAFEDRTLYSAGSDGASIYDAKRKTNPQVETITIYPAGDIFSALSREEDTVHVKINVEGAEIPIMNNLCSTHEIFKVNELCLFYDCVKVPGREMFMPMMERKLKLYPFLNNRLCINKQVIEYGDPALGENRQFVANWLKSINS